MKLDDARGVVVTCLLLAGLTPTRAGAQPGSHPANLPQRMTAGTCAFVVTLSQPPGATTTVQVDVNKLFLPAMPAGARAVAVRFAGPLAEGDVVRVRRVDPPTAPDGWDDTRTVTAGDGSSDCQAPERPSTVDDERDPFDAFAYLGYAFDNFAPGSVGGYGTDPGAQNGSEQKRYIAGVDFEFHVAGDGPRQLWIFGETMNGVRAADVTCAGENQPVVCGSLMKESGAQFRVRHSVLCHGAARRDDAHGWLQSDVRYISAVSGGSWAAVPFTFSKTDDAQLLGSVAAPGTLTRHLVEEKPEKGSLARSIVDSKLLAPGATEAAEIWARSYLDGRDVSSEVRSFTWPFLGGSTDQTYANRKARSVGDADEGGQRDGCDYLLVSCQKTPSAAGNR